MSRRQYIIWGICGIILLFAAFFTGRQSAPQQTASVVVGDSKDYPLLAARIFIDNPSDIRVNFSELRIQLKDYFSKNNVQGGLYFEYLPTGTSIRINADDKYRGVSLMKLPVAMELYKTAEQGHVNLDEKIKLKQEWLNNDFGDLYKKGAGYELTRRDAARIMLTDSDNTALRATLDVTETSLQDNDRALGYLDVDFQTVNDEISIGARSYSSFLKCLYFACYNTKEDSQEILDYLTETKFNDRIVAGIDDKDVKVAHKIGVFNTQVQSDCGIVYLPNRNYVLCVMIEGDNNSATNKHMADLSRFVYDYVSKAD